MNTATTAPGSGTSTAGPTGSPIGGGPTVARPDRDESAHLDLAEGARSFNYRRVVKPLLDDYERRVTASMAAGGSRPTDKEQAGALYAEDPDYLFACGLQRSMQQLAWRTAARSVERTPAAGAPPAPVAGAGPARLELDPTLPLPDWYTAAARGGSDDIHLVDGGYAGERVGEVYDLGGSVYRLAWRDGYDARPGALDAFVRLARPVGTGRIVDLGCSFGALTRSARRAHPDAEVIGLDISAPALRAAHAKAVEAGDAITYTQRDAARTGYETGSVDLVVAFLLLHEVPDDVRRTILAEAMRILRPGGEVLFLDIPPYRVLRPEQAFFESFDGRGNGEHHWEAYLSTDLPAWLADLGFEGVDEGPLDFDEPGYWGSSALWRTGEFDPVHRWVTRATAPAQASR
jgi:SAM-dependent methyltransferase